MINIDDLLNDKDRVCVPNHLIQLIKDNLEVVPITTYKLRSNCSEYEYTEDDLNYTKDHINQLIDDILLANLDKVKHLDNRIYRDLFEENKTYWLVKNNEIFKTKIDQINKYLEQIYEREYDYILTEHIYYKLDDFHIKMFNNNKNFLKFGGQYLDKFFETEDEALAYIKEQNGQTN